MAAFWHLFVPVTISTTMNKDEFEGIAENSNVLPEPFAQDFVEVNRNEWSDEHEILGTRLKMDLTYILSDKNREQIKPFLKEAWQLIEAENSSIIPKGLNEFIEETLNPFNFSSMSYENIEKELEEIEDNYYLRYESIPSMVVYHGWPEELHSRSRSYSIGGLIFLHSHEKMNVIPEETVLFYNLKEKIRRELSNRYAIANSLYTLGF
ncbi:hypothetical protein [Candidatus Parabeggiatoa sp. HSG14]|uniref:hypothetical protein n=1 Tax=Candidatus Parabeggiatoa sp. HSG14 TaxID=3055593 RepID=UPI0025A8FD6E|nr:hypothetical protein [Thiotrichales bacterium HSG14]